MPRRKINIINAEKIIGDELVNVEIIQFDYTFTFEKTIVAQKVNIKDYVWTIDDAKISEDNFNKTINEDLQFSSNFNAEKINNLFSNLTSLNFFELKSTKENYEELENTDHYLPNLLICTLGIKAIQILLNKIDVKYKKIFFTYLITTYGGIMAFLFVFNLNLIYLDNLNKELMSTQIKLEKIYNKIKNK